ncbi:hypothetical protein TNCV_2905321 [Trichonephila clavipes]|nr:hypothetical protein TNCV_2905321 [Trichonephila clavipes]
MERKRTSRVVKIEAELILEANRLQLMKQDLEKAENAYLSSFTSKKSKTLPGATAAAHGDPNGKNDYQKKVENSDKGVWVIDIAATSHFCNDKSLFLDLKPITNIKMSLATEDKSCPVEGIGTLRFRVKYKGSFHEITLTDVLFNPKLRRNLLSGSRLESKGAHFVGTKGRKPSVLHLKPFGCLAYAGVPKQIRKKFDMRAKMGIMMGYAQRTKGYRIWLIDENKLVETINVRFDENKRGINFRQKVNSNLEYNLNLPDYYDDDFDRVKDSLTSLVSKTSTETPSTSEKPGVSSDNHNLIPCTEVKWIRNIGRKVTGSNVYYSIEGEATRLKSFNEIERYYSDFATNRDDRVSMGGFITFIDETPISWRTFKQKSVSLSTMAAEGKLASFLATSLGPPEFFRKFEEKETNFKTYDARGSFSKDNRGL